MEAYEHLYILNIIDGYSISAFEAFTHCGIIVKTDMPLSGQQWDKLTEMMHTHNLVTTHQIQSLSIPFEQMSSEDMSALNEFYKFTHSWDININMFCEEDGSIDADNIQAHYRVYFRTLIDTFLKEILAGTNVHYVVTTAENVDNYMDYQS